MDQRLCVGLGGNRTLGPWARDLLQALSYVLGWTGVLTMGLKPSWRHL